VRSSTEEEHLSRRAAASGFESVEIDAARPAFGVPLQAVLSRGLFPAEEGLQRTAEQVIDGDPHIACRRDRIGDLGAGIERVGIVLVEREVLRDLYLKATELTIESPIAPGLIQKLPWQIAKSWITRNKARMASGYIFEQCMLVLSQCG
jgi:hypothetical protein